MNVKSIAGQLGEGRVRVALSSHSAYPLGGRWSLSGFVALTKPRVMILAFFTSIVGLSIAPIRLDPVTILATVLAIEAGAGAAAVLGACFLALEVREFAGMIAIGAGPQRSAFLSAFFTVVGCHGLHVAAGLVWLAVTMAQVAIRGLRPTVERGRWKCGEQMRWAARSISLSRSVRTNHQVIACLSKSRG